MVIETCNARVASNVSFYYDDKDGNEKKELYKQYQNVHPTWSITGDSSLEAASYWKWFLAKHTERVCGEFDMKPVDLPDSWKSLKREEVKEDIQKLYQQ